MSDLYYSLPVVIVSAITLYFAWRCSSRERWQIAILLLMIAGLALRIYTASDFFLHEWDERYHALVAKNLMQHPLKPTLYESPILPYDYKNWTANHIWVHKQILPLWAMSASMYTFGVNEIALRIPSIILSTAGIWMTFFIGSHFFDHKVGFLAAFLFSTNGLIIELSAGRVATDHYDIFFLVFIGLAIVFSIIFARRQKILFNFLAGVFLGAAILSKWLPALIVVPIWILIVKDVGTFRTRQILWHLGILLITAISLFLPWQLYIHSAFPAEAGWEAGYNIKHVYQVLEERSGPIYFFLDRMRIDYGELIYLPLLWFLWKWLKQPRNPKILAILIWILVPLVFFSIARTKMQAYILFSAPALFNLSAAFFHMLKDQSATGVIRWLYRVVLILLIALPLRYTIERVKPFDLIDRNPEWAEELRHLNGGNAQDAVLFNCSRPIEAMFYNDITAYSSLPDEQVLTDLMAQGYTVIVNDDGALPEGIGKLEGINFVHLSGD